MKIKNRLLKLAKHPQGYIIGCFAKGGKQFPFKSLVIHEEVLWGLERLYNIHSNFSHFHISTQRPDINTPSMFEAFLKHVNGTVEAHSPSKIQIRDGRGLTDDDLEQLASNITQDTADGFVEISEKLATKLKKQATEEGLI